MGSSNQRVAEYRSGQRAEDYLRRQIIDGYFEPGSRVSDASLSTVLGVGRTSVREAIQRLSTEGLIEMIPNRGAFVAEVSGREVRDLFELREALESFAAGLAAERASLERLNSLQEMLLASRSSLVKHGGQYPVQLDFHERVVSLSNNDALIESSRQVSNRLRVARVRSGSQPARADEALIEHEAVLNALLERNATKASEAMRNHLRHAQLSYEATAKNSALDRGAGMDTGHDSVVSLTGNSE